MQENNIINLSGVLDNQINVSHKIYNETFYKFDMKVKRLSETFDILPVTISERLVEKEFLEPGKKLNINGQIRSYNNYNVETGKTKLILTVFAKQINFESESENPNQVFLNGYICKAPIYRTTPFGREIADILLAVNRSHNKSDYIPCIAWGRNAKFARQLNISDNVKVEGRMQSRAYQKKLASGEILNKIAYEMSISKIELCSNNKLE